ncbi:leucine-rich repeat domain-containing protein [Sporobolomyces koalae]|uniref:leucine-rich repeat domain-containing protein n=1 Tax=Sporobolomyces koalae TaxID=500713 RepID=UPI003176850F
MATASPHLLSGLAKHWSPPQFSKDEPRAKFRQTFSAPLEAYFSSAGQHPDEEKGRSIRSATRVPTNPANLFSQPVGGLAAGFNIGELSEDVDGDGAFVDDWANDRAVHGAEEEFSQEGALQMLDELNLADCDVVTQRVPNDVVDWTKVLAHAVDHCDGNIDLSQKHLTQIPDSISELSCIRKLSAFPPRHLDRNIQSTPSLFSAALATPKSPPPASSPRSFARSSSIAASPGARVPVATAVPLTINLASNQLTADSLSNALFGLDNLRCLFLRKNELGHLPPGIGRLTNLVDLSLSTNQLEYLPAEILRLENLATLTLHPNPFYTPPSRLKPLAPVVDSEERQSTVDSRVLGPLETHFVTPSLREIALRLLLAADPSHPSHRLVERWESTSVREALPAHDYAAFASTFPPSSTAHSDFVRSRQASSSSTAAATTALPPQPFDPLANVCRSPCHPDEERVFFQHAVSRLEWVEERILKPRALEMQPNQHNRRGGPKTIPILWRGCTARCLDWLEDDDES